VRSPHRERKSITCTTITSTITDIAIGPTPRNISKSHPTTGNSMSAAGGLNDTSVPALPNGRISRFR
jgi:hypothetical protein